MGESEQSRVGGSLFPPRGWGWRWGQRRPPRSSLWEGKYLHPFMCCPIPLPLSTILFLPWGVGAVKLSKVPTPSSFFPAARWPPLPPFCSPGLSIFTPTQAFQLAATLAPWYPHTPQDFLSPARMGGRAQNGAQDPTQSLDPTLRGACTKEMPHRPLCPTPHSGLPETEGEGDSKLVVASSQRVLSSSTAQHRVESYI